MAEKRKVDSLAQPGSFLDKLRRRRLALDAGDPEQATEEFKKSGTEGTPSKKRKGLLRLLIE